MKNEVARIRSLYPPQYEEAVQLLMQQLQGVSGDQAFAGNIEILELGPGGDSLVLHALDEWLPVNQRRSTHIRIHFVDKNETLLETRGKGLRCLLTEGESRMIVPKRLAEAVEFSATFHRGDCNICLEKIRARELHLIVMHAVLHEIFSSPTCAAPPDRYFREFFKKLHALLGTGGRIVVGDPYYPPYLTRDETEALMQAQYKRTGHADAPVAFIHPERLLKIVLAGENSYKFTLMCDQQRFVAMDHAKGLPFGGRKYYLIVLKK